MAQYGPTFMSFCHFLRTPANVTSFGSLPAKFRQLTFLLPWRLNALTVMSFRQKKKVLAKWSLNPICLSSNVCESNSFVYPFKRLTDRRRATIHELCVYVDEHVTHRWTAETLSFQSVQSILVYGDCSGYNELQKRTKHPKREGTHLKSLLVALIDILPIKTS